MVVASCGRCRAIASISPVSATTVVYFYIDSSKVMVISGSTTHGDPDPGKRTDMLHLEGHSQVLPNTMTLRARSHTDDSSDSRLALAETKRQCSIKKLTRAAPKAKGRRGAVLVF